MKTRGWFRAAARFALTEKPTRDTPLSVELRTLRQVAGRLQAVVRQRTRLINQLHQLLAVSFPELALLVKDVSQGWVLELVHRYPTAGLLGAAFSARRERPRASDRRGDGAVRAGRPPVGLCEPIVRHDPGLTGVL